jgi:hypothetical protein
VWASGAVDPISYVVRFIGAHSEGEVKSIAEGLASKFECEDPQARYRDIVFATFPIAPRLNSLSGLAARAGSMRAWA